MFCGESDLRGNGKSSIFLPTAHPAGSRRLYHRVSNTGLNAVQSSITTTYMEVYPIPGLYRAQSAPCGASIQSWNNACSMQCTEVLKTPKAMPDIRSGTDEIQQDRMKISGTEKKFGKQILPNFMRQICLYCVNGFKNGFLVKF